MRESQLPLLPVEQREAYRDVALCAFLVCRAEGNKLTGIVLRDLEWAQELWTMHGLPLDS